MDQSAKVIHQAVQKAEPSRGLAVFLCLIPASYFVLIAVYALFNFSDYGAATPQFLRYIAAPLAIAALLFFAGCKLSPKRGADTGLLASAALITLLIIEAVLNARLVFALLNTVSVLEPAAQVPDNEDAVEAPVAVRGGSSIPPMFSPKQISRDLGIKDLDKAVLTGPPGKEVMLCAHDGAPIFYTADRFGFNNPSSLYNNPLELALVGDSFVEGHCQPAPDTFIGRMRGLRPQSASFGMRSGGPLLELAFIGRYAAHFEPDFVVMAFFAGNDWRNLKRETEMAYLPEALSPDADFGPVDLTQQQKNEIDVMMKDWWSRDVSPATVFSKSSFGRNILALNEVWGVLGLDYPRVAAKQPVYSDVLKRSKAITQGWGGKFAVLYIPQDARFRGLLDKSFVYDQLRDEVLFAAREAGVDVIDLTEKLDAQDDPTAFYAADGHFSPEGAQFAAEAVEAWIAKQNASSPAD